MVIGASCYLRPIEGIPINGFCPNKPKSEGPVCWGESPVDAAVPDFWMGAVFGHRLRGERCRDGEKKKR